MSKSLEELQREYEENTVKLEQEKRKLRRLENRKSYLDSGSRKQRSHRLITRGAAIESVMPEVKILTEQEFYSLMERIAECQKSAKEKRRNPATLQSLYADKNEGTLFPRPVVVGFLYAFCSSRHDF